MEMDSEIFKNLQSWAPFLSVPKCAILALHAMLINNNKILSAIYQEKSL